METQALRQPAADALRALLPLPLEIETEEDEFWVNGDRTYGYDYCAGNMAGNGKATRDEIDVLVCPQDSHGSSES